MSSTTDRLFWITCLKRSPGFCRWGLSWAITSAALLLLERFKWNCIENLWMWKLRMISHRNLFPDSLPGCASHSNVKEIPIHHWRHTSHIEGHLKRKYHSYKCINSHGEWRSGQHMKSVSIVHHKYKLFFFKVHPGGVQHRDNFKAKHYMESLTQCFSTVTADITIRTHRKQNKELVNIAHF